MMKTRSKRLQGIPFKPVLPIAFGLLLLSAAHLFPCTAAVVSGRVTPDGRPLLWKNRDTSNPHNKVVFLTGDKFDFIAVINADDKNAVSVWQGINSKGFAIINTASSDLASDSQGGGQNGIFMKRALGICADVADFEELLRATAGERKVSTNYGVIDARGEACFFETRDDSHVKYDANDPQAAPLGYIVRTNYAFSAPVKNAGGGYIRFERAQRLFEEAASRQELTCSFILSQAARDLVNEKLHSDPSSEAEFSTSANPLYINTNDTINRNSTVSVSVFHGAPDPEKAYLASMWVILGQPVTSAAIPLWVQAEGVPEELSGNDRAPLCDLSRELVSFLYDDLRGHMNQYMNATKLLKHKKWGILAALMGIEKAVMTEAENRTAEWEETVPGPEEVLAFEQQTARKVYEALKRSFSDILAEQRTPPQKNQTFDSGRQTGGRPFTSLFLPPFPLPVYPEREVPLFFGFPCPAPQKLQVFP